MRIRSLVNTLMCVAVCISAATWLPKAAGTSVVAPSTEFQGIPWGSLVAAVKVEFAKVGLKLRDESLHVGEDSQHIRLTFDYARDGGVRLQSTVEISIGSQGAKGTECFRWPCDMWFPGPSTHDGTEAEAVWKAYARAMAGLEAHVASIGGTTKRIGW